MFLCGHIYFHFSLGMELVGRMVALCLIIWGISRLISKVAPSFYNPPKQCMRVLISLYPCQHLLSGFFILAILVSMKWYLIAHSRLSWYMQRTCLQKRPSFWLLGYAVLRYFIFSSPLLPFVLLLLCYDVQSPTTCPSCVSGSRDAADERFQWSQDADTNNWTVYGWPTTHTVEATRNKHDR